MTDCIFCKIIAKEIPTDSLYEDDDVLIFRDNNPKAPTHLLIIPKEHIESVKTAEEAIPGILIAKAKQFAAEKDIPGYKLVFHVGREGGQIVNHIHLHLMAEKKI